jgi:outer membrane protein TolC
LRLTHASILLRWGLLGLIFAGLGAAIPGARAATEVDPDVMNTMPEDYFPALKMFIDLALLQSPQVIYQELNTEVAEAQKLYAGIAPLLPYVRGSIQDGTQVQSATVQGSVAQRQSGIYYDLQAGQPVFQWGQLKNGLLAQKVAVAIAERNYATVYLQYAGLIRKQFLGLITSKMAVRNARFNLELRKKAYNAAKEQLKAGATTDAAVMGPELDQDDAQLAFESNQQSYAYGRRQLARELGRTNLADDEIPAAVPEPRFSTSAASDLTADVLRTGARYTPDAQLGLLNVRNWALQYKINKVNLLPRVSLTADVNQQNQVQVQGNGVLQQNTVLSESYYIRADWNIFDGLATKGRMTEALLRRRQAERDLKAKTEATEDAAQNSQRQLELAWRTLLVATRRRGIAYASLQRAQDDLASHVGTEETVSALQANDYATEYALALSRTNFLSQWTDFVSLVGHDPAMNNLPAHYVRPVQ